MGTSKPTKGKIGSFAERARRQTRMFQDMKRFTKTFKPLMKAGELRTEYLSEHPLRLSLGLVERCLTVKGLSTAQWEDRRRLLNVVTDGIENGSIAINDADDIALCREVFSTGQTTGDVPLADVVAHYIDTGEFMDIMALAVKRSTDIGAEDEQNDDGVPFVEEQLRALYAHDMSQLKVETQGDDEKSVSALPIDIRLSFSGLYEDVAKGYLKKEPREIYDY